MTISDARLDELEAGHPMHHDEQDELIAEVKRLRGEVGYQESTKNAALGGLGRYEKRLQKVEAERDALQAAVDRVRREAESVLLKETDPPNDWNSALDYLAKRVLAALEGDKP